MPVTFSAAVVACAPSTSSGGSNSSCSMKVENTTIGMTTRVTFYFRQQNRLHVVGLSGTPARRSWGCLSQ
ncbi:hypothetical protein PF010_g7360 [Phytophthora fragariae]|uniref:Uncharacterized protein n=1 Tax=Phytophthora fragariae TaxID=53985 RepID=A0A6A4EDW4_9STRA|nr:hypothetical protein PF009_g3252 [Phytophthora fragariae]KAE9120801.1 hypothetical protein PF010_g7360 [Phytophthora fragariae]KAE9131797.1 hypothetical protein PF007_g3973 [Phytophthora fragariae]KAE9151198.1 hypothetical protein PF006_g4480 [Phytophthora fragariae]KAE9235920.1 hypothetical protein PF004_g8985 [Phytophthora fragariae]